MQFQNAMIYTEKFRFEHGAFAVENGLKLPLEQVAGVVPEHTEYRAYGADGGFLGIAQAEPETGLLRVGKNFS